MMEQAKRADITEAASKLFDANEALAGMRQAGIPHIHNLTKKQFIAFQLAQAEQIECNKRLESLIGGYANELCGQVRNY